MDSGSNSSDPSLIMGEVPSAALKRRFKSIKDKHSLPMLDLHVKPYLILKGTF